MDSVRSIKAAYTEYMAHLRDRGERVILPPSEPHDPERSQGLVFPSDLGMCPWAAFEKRQGSEEMYPESDERATWLTTIMNQGNFYEGLLAEALIWKLGQENVLTQVSCVNDKARGRADIVWHEAAHKRHVIEVKSGSPFAGRPPTPKRSHVLQALFYREVIGAVDTSDTLIVLFNRHSHQSFPFHIWTVLPIYGGYVVFDEDGNSLDEAWNNPDDLCAAALHQEIERHRQYLHGERSDIPMPDFLQHPDGWQCYHTIRKPKFYKTEDGAIQYGKAPALPHGDGWLVPGLISPRCPFFCHPHSGELLTLLDRDSGLIPAWDIGEF